jgi:type IV secretory pathway VirB10-like protein
MELLESNDFKRDLVKKSEKHREELQNEVRLVSEKTEKIITNALVIGGALAVTYFLLSQFSGGKSKPKQKVRKIKLIKEAEDDVAEVAETPAAPGVLSQIGTALASQASVILLDLAKEKLGEYMASRQSNKDTQE